VWAAAGTTSPRLQPEQGISKGRDTDVITPEIPCVLNHGRCVTSSSTAKMILLVERQKKRKGNDGRVSNKIKITLDKDFDKTGSVQQALIQHIPVLELVK
jgi:hypothetical protein